MDLAVNYSQAAGRLTAQGRIRVDRFKCPAWPNLIDQIEGDVPLYVHFPLLVGTGAGHPINTETNQPPDWEAIERLQARTQTPWISAHLGPRSEDHPKLSQLTWDEQVEEITKILIADLEPMVRRFGPDHVVGENIFEYFGVHLRPAVLPEVICHVIETLGCGFLLDLSHARLAARDLGVDPHTYVEALPVKHIRELHVTGIQRFDKPWIDRLRAAGVRSTHIDRIAGHWIDHLPMTSDDWDFFQWALSRIRENAWREPEIIAFEYGGVGPAFNALTIPEVLAEQVPQLYGMVHNEG